MIRIDSYIIAFYKSIMNWKNVRVLTISSMEVRRSIT